MCNVTYDLPTQKEVPEIGLRKFINNHTSSYFFYVAQKLIHKFHFFTLLSSSYGIPID